MNQSSSSIYFPQSSETSPLERASLYYMWSGSICWITCIKVTINASTIKIETVSSQNRRSMSQVKNLAKKSGFLQQSPCKLRSQNSSWNIQVYLCYLVPSLHQTGYSYLLFFLLKWKNLSSKTTYRLDADRCLRMLPIIVKDC